MGVLAEWSHYKHSSDRVKLCGEGYNLWLCVQHRSTSLRFPPCKESNQKLFLWGKNLWNKVSFEKDPKLSLKYIYIKLNMHNVWWYHKPFCCSNSSLFELDDFWFVRAIQYMYFVSKLYLPMNMYFSKYYIPIHVS